jgi:hypothetical protein
MKSAIPAGLSIAAVTASFRLTGRNEWAAVKTSPKELTRLAIEGTFRGKIWQGL